MTDAELTRACLTRFGGSASAFAREIVVRDPRQVRRWLAGTSELPKAVRDFLTQYLLAPTPNPFTPTALGEGSTNSSPTGEP